MLVNNPSNTEHLLPSFYFRVAFSGALGSALPSDNSFLEVSGISAEVKNKPYKEGGENRFTHQLPEGVEYTNLILKRGIASMSSPLVLWCRQIIEGGFVMPILTQELTVSLMDSSGAPARSWSFVNARPVKWEVEGFNSTKNEVAIEKIELAYNYFDRIL
ncbi:MAG: phage tail protein [Gammaproteobacteria bacterium]|nr:phage tail protein [Gammaproteobacteria bacterium]